MHGFTHKGMCIHIKAHLFVNTMLATFIGIKFWVMVDVACLSADG